MDFGFNSIPAFRPHIRDLESAGLVVCTQDEGDKRRKTIQITTTVNSHLFSSDASGQGPRMTPESADGFRNLWA
jgi:hypothetical protein